jgi:hypothetical protein
MECSNRSRREKKHDDVQMEDNERYAEHCVGNNNHKTDEEGKSFIAVGPTKQQASSKKTNVAARSSRPKITQYDLLFVRAIVENIV